MHKSVICRPELTKTRGHLCHDAKHISLVSIIVVSQVFSKKISIAQGSLLLAYIHTRERGARPLHHIPIYAVETSSAFF